MAARLPSRRDKEKSDAELLREMHEARGVAIALESTDAIMTEIRGKQDE